MIYHLIVYIESQATSHLGDADDISETLAPQLVVWGTDVNVARCQERFRRFLREFRLSDYIENGGVEESDAHATVAEPTAPSVC